MTSSSLYYMTNAPKWFVYFQKQQISGKVQFQETEKAPKNFDALSF